MQVVKYAKYVGTMIGPDGRIHRWTAPREKMHSTCPENQHFYQKSGRATVRLQDLFDFRVRVHLDPHPNLTKPLSQPRPMLHSVLLQDHTMLFPPTNKALVPCAALVLA